MILQADPVILHTGNCKEIKMTILTQFGILSLHLNIFFFYFFLRILSLPMIFFLGILGYIYKFYFFGILNVYLDS